MKFRGITPVGAAGLLLLAAVDFWLVAIVTREILLEDAAAADKAEWNAHLVASPAVAAKQKPIDDYREIIVHPVFFKSREPWVAPPPVAVAPPPPPPPVDPGVVLGGIMIKSELKTAYLFSRAAAASGSWIKEGDAFMGWKVVSISKGGAKLEQMGRSVELTLYPEP